MAQKTDSKAAELLWIFPRNGQGQPPGWIQENVGFIVSYKELRRRS